MLFLSLHVVPVTILLEKGVFGPGEIVAGIVVFQNQLGMIMNQLCMAMYGYVWLCMAIYGYVGLCIAM